MGTWKNRHLVESVQLPANYGFEQWIQKITMCY